MRVLRTVTIENSAATKKPLAKTSASDGPRAATAPGSQMRELHGRNRYAFLLLKKCASTKLSMIVWLAASTFSNWMPMPTRRSLQATRALGVDVPLRSRHAEADLDLRAALERAGGADGDAAVTEVERQRRGDRVAEPVLNRDAEHDPRAAAAVEVVGKQVRRERRQDVLHGAVLVDVAGDAERGELAHFVGARDRAAEDQNRQPPFVELADRADQVDARRVRQPQIEDDQIDLCKIGADPRQQLGRALDRRSPCAPRSRPRHETDRARTPCRRRRRRSSSLTGAVLISGSVRIAPPEGSAALQMSQHVSL